RPRPRRRRSGLRATLGAPVRGGSAAGGVRRPARSAPTTMSVYVYALLGETPCVEAGVGLLDEPLRAVRVGDLVAAVGEMAQPPAVNEATLRAHDAVVRRLANAV